MRAPRSLVGALLAPLVVLPACGGPAARAPGGPGTSPAPAFMAALRAEALEAPTVARDAYLRVVERMAGESASPWQVPATVASLDALVHRNVASLGPVTESSALVFRMTAAEGQTLASKLEEARGHAAGPFAGPLLARALLTLAEQRGEVARAAELRAATGCVSQATLVGPLSWAPVSGVDDPDPLAAVGTPLEKAYRVPGGFDVAAPPLPLEGRGCGLDPALVSPAPGVREVLVDVILERPTRLGVALRAQGPAVLRVGGEVILRRPYGLGADETLQLATVEVSAGTVRVTVRVGMTDDGEPLELSLTDEAGKPVKTHAPKPGDVAHGTAKNPRVVVLASPPTGGGDEERALAAAAALGSGNGHGAERLLAERVMQGPSAPPELALLYGRAVESAPDLSSVHRAERARAAYERVLDAWPGAWEAILAHANLAAVRRGQEDALLTALQDLDEHRGKVADGNRGILDAFDAAISGREHLRDRARDALVRAQKAMGDSPLAIEAERRAMDRVGAEAVAFACQGAGARPRSGFACFHALRATGDYEGSQKELTRVRGLFLAPHAFLPLEAREALGHGDEGRARTAFEAMAPAERTLSLVELLGGQHKGEGGGDAHGKALRAAAAAMVTTARDAPFALPPLLRAAGDDAAASFEARLAGLVATERAQGGDAKGGATSVLLHEERYHLDPSGLLRALLIDLRRVGGTTDVEENAQAEPPDVAGRTVLRVLRRRIHKKDGRVVEPDRTPHAAQAHADLSQLEQGDLVEAIYETWAVPGETGDVGIDTPDLLPNRTAVREGLLELRLPAGLKGTLWSHALLGKPEESREGSERILRWRVKDKPVRRVELGAPKMDRAVSVSFSTALWPSVGAALRETMAALEDDHDPEVVAWARGAASTKKGADLVTAVVEAAGATVREASPELLSDTGVGRARGPQTTTARTLLVEHEGSRSWLIVRALRELGVAAEVVVAEDEPFSADPAFPPHFGRFTHPLVVARPEGASETWIDADVAGPPLPAGRISPGLRGRTVLHVDGTLTKVPVMGGIHDDRDEVDLRLTVDGKGDAKGTFTILLRGREAQDLAEALLRVVGAERQRALRGVVLAWVPFADVEDVALSSSEGSWQIAIRATVSVVGYAQPVGGNGSPKGARPAKDGKAADPAPTSWSLPGIEPLHFAYPRAFVTTLSATYARQGARQEALAVNDAARYHVHRRVELPKGAVVTRSPGAFEVNTPALVSLRRITVSPQAVEDEFALDVPTGTIPPEHYGAFVRDVHRTDDAFLASTRVKLDAPPTK